MPLTKFGKFEKTIQSILFFEIEEIESEYKEIRPYGIDGSCLDIDSQRDEEWWSLTFYYDPNSKIYTYFDAVCSSYEEACEYVRDHHKSYLCKKRNKQSST